MLASSRLANRARAIAACLGCARNQFSTSSSAQPSGKILITTPIFYVNARPHIGHLYSALLADALSRWYRMRGSETIFSTGTDEHGIKVQEAAEANGASAADFCDEVSSSFREVFDAADIQYDDYVRTTEPRHKLAVETLWTKLQSGGHIYLGTHEGWYCKSDEAFLTDGQVVEEEYLADDGSSQKRFVSAESGRPVQRLSEPNYKFRLSAFQAPLLEWLDNNPDSVTPAVRRNEVRAMVARGLEDVSVSRLAEKIQWALPVPGDQEHNIYVWLDALSNYLTVTGYGDEWTDAEGENGVAWPADYHIVGKDILKFHAVYWPAFLLAAGLPLPLRVVAHAHWTVGKVKMSKSLGNSLSPTNLIEQYGLEPTRYFLLSQGGLANDADFSHNEMVLMDTLGNLLTRSMAPRVLKKTGDAVLMPSVALGDEETELVEVLTGLPERVAECYEKVDFCRGTELIMGALRTTNSYFSKNEPWVLARQIKEGGGICEQQQERLDTVLYMTLEAVRVSTLLLLPIIPQSCNQILDYLGVPEERRTALPSDIQFGRNPGEVLAPVKKIRVFKKLE